jgi:hypothetical protein
MLLIPVQEVILTLVTSKLANKKVRATGTDTANEFMKRNWKYFVMASADLKTESSDDYVLQAAGLKIFFYGPHLMYDFE